MAREHIPSRYDTRKDNNSGELEWQPGKWSCGRSRAHSNDPDQAFFERHRILGRLDQTLRERLFKRVYAKNVCFDVVQGMIELAGGKLPCAPYSKHIYDGHDSHSSQSGFATQYYERYTAARKSSVLFGKLLKNFHMEEIVEMYEFCLKHIPEQDKFTFNMMGYDFV